jgi:hypothetical protein
MFSNSDRRNPLRLIVSKQTQLRILWLVTGGVFVSMLALVAIFLWIDRGWWTLAMGLAVGGMISLAVSRQIAGPFYRIEKDLEAWLEGAREGKYIQLRPGDPLHHLSGLINELLQLAKN